MPRPFRTDATARPAAGRARDCNCNRKFDFGETSLPAHVCVSAAKKQGSHFLATLFGESGPAWRTRRTSEPVARRLSRLNATRSDERSEPTSALADCRCGSRLLERGVRPHSRHEESMIQIQAVLFLKSRERN